MLKKDILKLAEVGCRERLRVIQTELNDLARSFPHIVRNADGTIPSVMPVERKTGVAGLGPAEIHKEGAKAKAKQKASQKANGAAGKAIVRGGSSGKRQPLDVSVAAIRNYLDAVPTHEATTSELAKVTGLSTARTLKILMAGKFAGRREPNPSTGRGMRNQWSNA